MGETQGERAETSFQAEYRRKLRRLRQDQGRRLRQVAKDEREQGPICPSCSAVIGDAVQDVTTKSASGISLITVICSCCGFVANFAKDVVDMRTEGPPLQRIDDLGRAGAVES